jgi:lysophospholipase L1-like esterase
MKLITLGDSITRGTFTNFGESCPMSVANPNYSAILKTLLNADELVCHGLNGISISRTSSVNPEYAMSIECEKLSGADVFIIAGGTNDWATNVPLGNENDQTDVSFYGGLSVLYGKVKKQNPNAKIFAVLPINRQGEKTTKNAHGLFLDEYREAIEKRANSFGFYVIDGRQIPINPDDEEERKKYILDGLHPNCEAHKLYGEFLYLEIQKTL